LFLIYRAAKWLDGKIDEPRKKREQERLQKMFRQTPRRADSSSKKPPEKQ
jgi:hypothetical protein